LCCLFFCLLVIVLFVLLSFGHCVVCSSVFWSLCCLFFCLLVIVLSVLRQFVDSDYPFGIFHSTSGRFFRSMCKTAQLRRYDIFLSIRVPSGITQ
jgi:hypothetical protein